MATGTVRDAMQDVKTVKFAHTAAVGKGDVIVNNGHVRVAVNDALINADNVFVSKGRVEFPKEAALAIAVGDIVYWVAANGNANKTASGNTKIGTCVEAAAASDTVVLCELDENR